LVAVASGYAEPQLGGHLDVTQLTISLPTQAG